ncbi:MAG: hypothetical protein QOD99_813 [Chthoniobacter sp.]|jgi:arsenate reductase|nr:hypothetical protein [Chthoniobacter sp.]
MKKKILFICVHNSARSQMAEALMNQLCGDEFEAESAGLLPGKLNPFAVEALAEVGINISQKQTRSVDEVLEKGDSFAFAITVCSESESEGCPIFPSATQRLHWPFPDPSKFEGTHDEKLVKTREVRELIRAKIEDWCASACAKTAG